MTDKLESFSFESMHARVLAWAEELGVLMADSRIRPIDAQVAATILDHHGAEAAIVFLKKIIEVRSAEDASTGCDVVAWGDCEREQNGPTG